MCVRRPQQFSFDLKHQRFLLRPFAKPSKYYWLDGETHFALVLHFDDFALPARWNLGATVGDEPVQAQTRSKLDLIARLPPRKQRGEKARSLQVNQPVATTRGPSIDEAP